MIWCKRYFAYSERENVVAGILLDKHEGKS